MANDLEKAPVKGACGALGRYARMSDAYWLWHAPEYFLTVQSAQAVARKDWQVYMDASPSKIAVDHDGGIVGRPRHDRRRRYDLVIWQKSANKVRALVEVKRSSDVTNLRGDVRKLKAALKGKKGPSAAYLLVYSEARDGRKHRRAALLDRFESWAEKLKVQLVRVRAQAPKGENAEDGKGRPWAWGIGLYRI